MFHVAARVVSQKNSNCLQALSQRFATYGAMDGLYVQFIHADSNAVSTVLYPLFHPKSVTVVAVCYVVAAC
jgi:hypothetical protein